jgi:hypothetical protein
VAYRDDVLSSKVTVMKFNSVTSVWEAVGTKGFSDGNAMDISLAIDNGTPYVAYKDRANGGKATVMKFDGLMNRVTVGNK